jgi:hypothetical protein
VSAGVVCRIIATTGEEVTLKETMISPIGLECFWPVLRLSTHFVVSASNRPAIILEIKENKCE